MLLIRRKEPSVSAEGFYLLDCSSVAILSMSSDHRRSRASHSHALTRIIFAAGTFGLDMDQSLARTCSYKHSFSKMRGY
jgi:hypothetical protein